MSGARIVYATAPDLDTARRIARPLLEEKLIACANLFPGMESLYAWDGEIEAGHEVVLILKTWTDRVDALLKRLEELHPYETPCGLVLTVDSGLPDYLAWIEGETR
jgi:periplasmic divalent cation tolerance protein